MRALLRSCALLTSLALVACAGGSPTPNDFPPRPTDTPGLAAPTATTLAPTGVATRAGVVATPPGIAPAPSLAQGTPATPPTAERTPLPASSPATATAGATRTATVDANQLPVPALYPVPASCAVAAWSEREVRRTFSARWLDGDGLAAGINGGALYAAWQTIQWQAEPGGRALAVTGARLDGPAEPARAENVVSIGVGTWASGVIFPAPGCWRLRATDQVHSLDTVVYVYPAGCQPPAQREPGSDLADRCFPPAPGQ